MGLFEQEYQKLNAEQRVAVDALEGPVLVIAGPGTGKTQLLTTKVANILRKTDAQPQNILCLTFTESAAYEMRQRLVNLIGQMAYNITISTYHAFGSELIRRFPEYFTDSTDLRPIDELGQHTILEEIIGGLSYANPLKKSAYYVRDVLSTISDLKRALLTPDDVRAVASANEQVVKALSRHAKRELAGLVRVSANSLPLFTKLAKATKPLAAKQNAGTGVLALGYVWQTELVAALEECQASGNTKAITSWKNKWLVRDANNNLVVGGTGTNRKLAALADIYQQYLDTLAQRSLFDYDDMILRAISGLEKHTELRYTLQEQYLHLLLDEFQDTNAAQLKLVKLFSDNPIYEGKPNVLAVGDDDQAIYAFQGANYSHMLAFKEMYRDVQVVTLTANYRSHPDILHTAHGIAGQIEQRLHHHMEEVQKVLTAESQELPEKAQVERHEFKSDLAEYAWVARKISALIAKGVPASEIAILAPQHRYLEPLVPYLHQAKIPVRYEKRENVLEDTHIVQLLRLSELVMSLQQNNLRSAASLWPEILSYDFWQLPVDVVWRLSWKAADQHQDWTQLLLKKPKTKPIAEFVLRLANLANLETLETMLDYLIGITELTTGKASQAYRSPFYSHNFSARRQKQDVSSFWNLLSNLTVLRQHLREYRQAEGQPLQLQDLVSFAQEHRQANIKILNTSPYHEATEAVQVMTPYRAKGLEFAHVFVVAAVDEVWGTRASGQSARLPLPVNLNFVRYQGQNNDERLRLFFVALTRAKHGLYLTSYQANFANKPTSRLKFLNEIEQQGKVLSPMLPSHSQTVKRGREAAPAVEELASYWQLRHLDAQQQPKLRDLLKHRLDTYQLAPTHLNSFTDLINGGPQNFFLATILKFPKAPTPNGEFGNAIHETIEWIHLRQRASGKLPAKTTIIKAFDAKLRARHLSATDTKLLLERGHHALEAFITQRLKTFQSNDEHEFSFRNQGVFLGHSHLAGKIDKLIINAKDRTIQIVDYKTGGSYSRWSGSDPKLHKYRQQLCMYKLLVEGSYQFADYRVTGACLEFVEPDDNGRIVQLPITFDAKEMERLKKLVLAVWDRIKALDFPAYDKYSLDMKGIQAFEDGLLD